MKAGNTTIIGWVLVVIGSILALYLFMMVFESYPGAFSKDFIITWLRDLIMILAAISVGVFIIFNNKI